MKLTHYIYYTYFRLSRARRIVESAFGIFSNRFRVFLNEIYVEPHFTRTLVLAGCALHNFLRDRSNHQCWPQNLTDVEDVDTG